MTNVHRFSKKANKKLPTIKGPTLILFIHILTKPIFFIMRTLALQPQCSQVSTSSIHPSSSNNRFMTLLSSNIIYQCFWFYFLKDKVLFYHFFLFIVSVPVFDLLLPLSLFSLLLQIYRIVLMKYTIYMYKYGLWNVVD